MRKNQETYLDMVVEKATRIATEQAIVIHQKLKVDDEKKEKDRRLRNTKLLLRNYRDFKTYTDRVERTVKKKNTITDEELSIKDLLVRGDDIVQSIKQSEQRTLVMVEYLDKALDTLEFMYKQENNEKYYSILKKRYIHDVEILDIAEFYRMNERSIYKVLNIVEERLSILLFGVYGIHIESAGQL